MTNTSQIKTQNWAWNLALMLSFLFLVYLPAKEVFIDKEQYGGYVEPVSYTTLTLPTTPYVSIYAVAVAIQKKRVLTLTSAQAYT